MSWCPNCGSEYETGVTECTDCGVALVDQPPADQTVNLSGEDDTVVVMEAKSMMEAQVAEATLEAEGVDAYVQTTASPSPNVGVMGDDVPELDVVVASEDAARAAQILGEAPVSDEELAQLAVSDSSEDV